MSWTVVVFSAVLTGAFCAGFAVIMDRVFDRLSVWAGIGVLFVSGFTGSLFAQSVLRTMR